MQTNRVTLRTADVGGAAAGPAVSKTLGTQLCPRPDCQGLRGEQDTVLQKSWRAGSVFAETWLSLLSQICPSSTGTAEEL